MLANENINSSLEDIDKNIERLNSEFCRQAGFFCTAVLNTPVYINVTLEDCPLGFNLIDRRVCDCDRALKELRINEKMELKCQLQDHTGYINRTGSLWVGVDTRENNSGVYYWHKYCLSDYCASFASVELTSPDGQCNPNRAGIMCGGCQANYSLELGGNRCIKCDNNFLGLLILFAVLGLLLVAVIKVLDLTVANGTINGLIFYANIVWINNPILFREGVNPHIRNMIVIPIAWINLDFGIETCLSANLDQVTKTGLQFVFPVYIWCIAFLIIIICHYSTRATKLFGNNSVAVLATLFLLSYGKLFRNITDVFTLAAITGSNGETRKVWYLDGNIDYGVTPSHIVLILVATLFLIFFWLPYTLSIVLVPFLRSKSHLRPLRWITTLQPFYDTYFGPYKSKRQYQVWTGILLLARSLTMVVFAASSTSSPNTNILLIVVMSVLLQTYTALVGYIYRKWYLSLLECLYLLNLCILSGTFNLYQFDEDKRNPTANISVYIVLFQFGCTLIFHLIKQILPLKAMVSKWLQERRERKSKAKDSEFVPSAKETKPTTQEVNLKTIHHDVSHFREDILEFQTN